jgi:glycosyltransferase involved in cell wall biosynthesis
MPPGIAKKSGIKTMIDNLLDHRPMPMNGDHQTLPNTDGEVSRRGPIRILELRAAGGAGGGPEKTILQGAARSDPKRFAVTVCYLRDLVDEDFDIDSRARKLGIDYVEVRQRHALDTDIWKAVLSLVRQRRIDIAHAHDYKTDLLAWLLGCWERVIPLSTAHGWTGHGWKEKLLYYPIDKRLLAKFPRVIAVSGEIRQVLLQHGARPDRVQTVVNGIDHRAFRRERTQEAEARERFGLKPGLTVIGGIGRLAPEKRFDVLLEAVATLARGRPEIRLVIAGEGPEREALARKADELGIAPVCRFLGYCGNIIELHHALDVFVQSSDYEGTPNVVLEAMALETPLVATDVGGTAEIAADGLIVPPGNPLEMARAIARTLGEREETAQRVRASRQRVEESLSFETRMHRVEEIYEELLTEKRRQVGRQLPARGWNRGL